MPDDSIEKRFDRVEGRLIAIETELRVLRWVVAVGISFGALLVTVVQ